MLQLYHTEKKRIIENYERRKPFFVGELQQSIRRNYTYDFEGNRIERPLEDYMPDRENWSGLNFWFECFQTELTKLDNEYKDYLPKPAQKYMWIGINPQHKSIIDLYKDLQKLKLDKYIACVEAHTEGGYRPHIHMIYTGHHKPFRIIEKLSKHFNCPSNFIEAKNFTKYYDEKLAYIRGEKISEKMEYVTKDKEERDKNSVPHYVEIQ